MKCRGSSDGWVYGLGLGLGLVVLQRRKSEYKYLYLPAITPLNASGGLCDPEDWQEACGTRPPRSTFPLAAAPVHAPPPHSACVGGNFWEPTGESVCVCVCGCVCVCVQCVCVCGVCVCVLFCVCVCV